MWSCVAAGVVGMLAGLGAGCGPACEEVSCERVGRAGCLACDREERGSSGDGEEYCNIICSSFVTCGNGLLDPGEICDDGPWGSGQLGCAADCASTSCGDQATSPGEVCLTPEVFIRWSADGLAHDMDGDGLTDLVFGAGVVYRAPELLGGSGVVLANEARGSGMVALELDGTPPAELVFGGVSTLSVVSMATTPGQVIATLPATPTGGHLVAGDVDADGDVDVVATRGAPAAGVPFTTMIVRNDGAGGLTAEPASDCAGAPQLANLDEDPDLELVGATSDFRAVQVCDLMGGRYVSVPSVGAPGPLGPVADPRLADLDGDGDPDLLWRASDLNIVMAPGGPGLTFTAPFVLYGSHHGFGGTLIATPDLDGDGAPDLLLADGTVLRMTTPRTATPVGALATAVPPFERLDNLRISAFDIIGPVIADFTGDGLLDVAADGVVLRSSP